MNQDSTRYLASSNIRVSADTNKTNPFNEVENAMNDA